VTVKTPEISVVISAKNEEMTVAGVVRGARTYSDDVIVMDGHSTDGTVGLAREAGATVHADTAQGKGAAVREGLRIARGRIVVLMDADGSHDASALPALVAPIRAAAADLVVGSRFTGGSEELTATLPQLVRMIGNVSMNIAINWRFGAALTDTLNGFRAIRRDVVDELGLRENRHTIEQEMIIQALRRGYRVVNVPTHEYARRHGRSRINIWLEWPLFVWCLARNLVQPSTARTDSAGHAGPELAHRPHGEAD
jgi:glycosyltransferase involved in cell wall biosynthesis